MAGVTKDQIFAAAEELMQEGINPTLTNVRKKLGTGSYSTITAAMAEWREGRKAPDAPIKELAPERISERLSVLGDEIWSIAQQIASDRLKAEREALEVARKEMEAQQAETAEMADQLAAEVEQLRQDKLDLQHELQSSYDDRRDLEAALHRAQVDLASATASAASAEKWVVELQEKNDLADSKIAGVNLENDDLRLSIARYQLQIEARDQTIADLKASLEEAKQAAADQQERANALSVENGKMQGTVEALQTQLGHQWSVITELKEINKEMKKMASPVKKKNASPAAEGESEKEN